MKNSKLKLPRVILLCGVIFCAVQVNAQNLLNLPEPATGTTRYPSYAAIEKNWPAVHGQGSVCFWGDDKFAAVSLTIDDNNYPDVSFWRQVSAEFGWKLTWFLIVYPGMWDIYNNVPGGNVGYSGSAAQWKALYEEGHEIGLHGSCGSMNTLSEAAYQEHMELSRAHLESVISNNIVTYAYPCGTVDSPTAVDGYRNVCSNLFIGARGTAGGSTSPFTGDYMNTSSMGSGFDQTRFDRMEDNTRPLLYSSYRGWAVFLWHGLLGNTNKIAGAYEVFNYLNANKDKYWIKTFGEVARYAQERESSVLDVNSVTADQIRFTLTDSMTNSIFNYPLTVKFRVDNWADAAAEQNGQSIPVSLITYSNSTYALVQAVPDQGTVILSKAAAASFSISPSSGWAPLTVTFTDTSILSGISGRYWDFGDGFTTNTSAENITHTYTATGTNTVTLIVDSAEGIYTNIRPAAVVAIVPTAPSAGFTVSPSSGNVPLTVTFTDTSSGSVTNRYWDFGDGSATNTTAAGVMYTYTVPGTNTVQLIVTGPAGASTNTQTAAVTVEPPAPPEASFSATPVSGTVPLNVTFTDTSTGSITNRFWDFGDGSTTNTVAAGLTHLYTLAGARTVKLVVSGPAGSSTNMQTDLISVVSGTAGGLIVYDSFTAPTNARGAVAGWAPDGWTATDLTTANANAYIREGSLNVSGLKPSEGNSLGLANRTGDYYLDFNTVTLAAGDTVYFSFIQKFNVIPGSTVNGANGYIRLGNSADAVTVTKGICISRGSDGTPAASNAGFALSANSAVYSTSGTHPKTPGTYDMTATYFIVGSYTRGAGATDGSLKLWINPDSATFGAANPPSPTLSMASLSSADTFNRLLINANGSGSWPLDWQIDEVRISTDWANAAPSSSPEPVDEPVITSMLNATGTVGQAFSYQITADNNPAGFDATGLPAGLSVNTNSGVISGIPAFAGSNNVTISASNAGGTDSRPLALVISPVPVDGNGNGIPDAWEQEHYGTNSVNPEAIAANGVNTIRQTYIAGLNPTNPQSVLAVSGGPAVAGMQLQWAAVSGRVYGIYRAVNLISGFQPLETNILWPQNSWTGAMDQAEGFYQLKVELAPAN